MPEKEGYCIAVSQAEFARRLGVNRAYVTRLKQAGRLVVNEEGKVDVEASLMRIRETGGSRPDVAQRFAHIRGSDVSAPSAERTATEDPIGESYQRARAIKEKFLALTAKAEYERLMRTLVPREEVVAALDDLVATLHATLESLPHRLAPRLVHKDHEAIVAAIREEIVIMMREAHRAAARELSELVSSEADNGSA